MIGAILSLYLLGYSANPGLMGGCAVVIEYHTPGGRVTAVMECTYGAGAECTIGTLKTCKVPVYSRDLSDLDHVLAPAQILAELIRDNDPSLLGPVTRYATQAEITTLWLTDDHEASGHWCQDKRPADQKRDGQRVCHGK